MKNVFIAKSFWRVVFLFLLLVLLLWGIYYFINGLINPPLYVVVEFNELGPIYNRMPVYYKGYKIGKTEKIKPSDDYKTTLVTVRFFPHDLKLPSNTIAKVKPLSTTRDYIELIYPKRPSSSMLKTGDKIKGSTTIDVQSFMNAQYESGAIGFIIENASVALTGIANASNEAGILLKTLNITVQENRKSMLQIMGNLNQTSENIYELSEKINNSINQDSMNNLSTDVQKTVKNIEDITKNMSDSFRHIDSLFCNLDATAANINAISSDAKKSAYERKGIFRLLLGSKNSLNQKCVKNNN